MGLIGIQERVSHLEGSFAVESDPGEGALLRVILWGGAMRCHRFPS